MSKIDNAAREATAAADAEAVHTLMAGVASEMGGTAQRDAEQHSHSAYGILRVDDLTLRYSARVGGYQTAAERDKVSIYGTWPECPSGDHRPIMPSGVSWDTHRISVSVSRTAKAIAADIRRRLLPDYGAAYQAAVDIRDERAEYQDGRRRIADQIAAAHPSLFVSGNKGSEVVYINNSHRRAGHSIYGEVGALSPRDGKVNIDLHGIPADMAARWLAEALNYAPGKG